MNTIDLYLGTFLILSGFSLSLLNLRRIVKRKDTTFSPVLLSENILLMCIGIAFVSRSIYEINSENIDFIDMEERSAELKQDKPRPCDIFYVLMSYGPLIISLVNSFLSLIVDNYMHYMMLGDLKDKEDGDNVQDISHQVTFRRFEVKKFLYTWKKYFSVIAIVLQWIIPLLTALLMYPMGVKEMTIPINGLRSLRTSCMAMLEINNITCPTLEINVTAVDRNYIPVTDYLEHYEKQLQKSNRTAQLNSVINNIYHIVADLKNNSTFLDINMTSPFLYRTPKTVNKCMTVCYLENKKLLLYMFLLTVVSFFVPITISMIILTKIHMMKVKKANVKAYASRELLYHTVFWTPVMFDTVLSLIFCSYSINGMRTSLINVIANIYQAVKNFMNTKYFKENVVVPV